MKKSGYVIFGVILFLGLTFLGASIVNGGVNTCKGNCQESFKEAKNLCATEYSECKNQTNENIFSFSCYEQKKACLKNISAEYKECRKECDQDKKEICLEIGEGEKFNIGCEKCECKKKGRYSCRLDDFCNKNTTITQKQCEDGGGLYQNFCNGPYFDIVCANQKFCLCEGKMNYTCGEGYECSHEFIQPNKRKHTLEGWKTPLGVPLGEVGICVQNSGGGE